MTFLVYPLKDKHISLDLPAFENAHYNINWQTYVFKALTKIFISLSFQGEGVLISNAILEVISWNIQKEMKYFKPKNQALKKKMSKSEFDVILSTFDKNFRDIKAENYNENEVIEYIMYLHDLVISTKYFQLILKKKKI